MSGKTLNQPSFTCWTTSVTTTLPRKQALGASLLSAYSWLSMALGLAQMVLDVWKNLKPTQLIILDNCFCNNFPKKSISGDVWAQGPPGTCWRLPRWSGPEILRAQDFFGPWGSSPGGSLLYYIYRWRAHYNTADMLSTFRTLLGSGSIVYCLRVDFVTLMRVLKEHIHSLLFIGAWRLKNSRLKRTTTALCE